MYVKVLMLTVSICVRTCLQYPMYCFLECIQLTITWQKSKQERDVPVLAPHNDKNKSL